MKIPQKVDATAYKKTKIIATIGPASQEKIPDLLAAGVNGIRMNFSHGTHTTHQVTFDAVRAAAKKLDRSVALIQDLQGPKIRLGKLPTGGVEISSGQTLMFEYQADPKNTDILPTQYDISTEVKAGEQLFLRDGQIRTIIKSVKDKVVTVQVQNSGKVLSDHGINLPDTQFTRSVLTPKDRKDLEFTKRNEIDYVAMSFVQTAKDIEELRGLLQKLGSTARIIAKIETKVAIDNLEEIVKASDAVMVARGDLAVEISPEQVPIVGREMILLCRRHKTPVIMATQMMESMMSSQTPSRAEANDVATAVSLGVDAMMLSGETAIGQFPVETVMMMKRIILSSEKYFVTSSMAVEMLDETDQIVDATIKPDSSLLDKIGQKTRLVFSREPVAEGKISSTAAQTSISLAATTLAEQLKAKLILAETLTGSTALSISSLRPNAPIIIASPDRKVCNQMAIVWGGKPFLVSRKKNTSVGVVQKLKNRGSVQKGDWIVTAFGKNHNVAGGTDTVRLLEVS